MFVLVCCDLFGFLICPHSWGQALGHSARGSVGLAPLPPCSALCWGWRLCGLCPLVPTTLWILNTQPSGPEDLGAYPSGHSCQAEVPFLKPTVPPRQPSGPALTLSLKGPSGVGSPLLLGAQGLIPPCQFPLTCPLLL